MVSEGVIEGVRTDRGVHIKQVSVKREVFDSIYSGVSRPSDKGGGHQDPEIRGGAWS